LVAAAIVVSTSAACWAETPEFSNNRPQGMQLFQGKLLGGQAWWGRYGEPVNYTAQAQAEASMSDKNALPSPAPMYGDGGYVFGPGTCDCPPPCIGHLWAGYFQNPKRCHMLHRHCGCNAGGNGCNDGCNTGGHCHPFLSRIFSHGCCDTNSCTSSVSCGCAVPTCSAPTCTAPTPSCAAPSCGAPSCSAPSCSATADCGCKPVCGKCRHCHSGNKWRGFMAHWNSGCGWTSCSAPLSCGCATPMYAAPTSEKQASQGPPTPMPEEAALFPLTRLK